jgi:hypothetical protein
MHHPLSTVNPFEAALEMHSSASRVFPMPASPQMKKVEPLPDNALSIAE